MEPMTPASPRHARFAAAKSLFADNPLLVVIAGIGFAVSFQTIAHLARVQHMPGNPVAYPVLIDVGFLAAVIEERHAIADGRSDIAPRVLAWLLGALTVYVNAHGSPAGDWLGLTLHVSAPALWIAFLELTRWRKIRKAKAPTAEEARLARATGDARRYAIDLARSLRGPAWRWRVPSLLRRQVLGGRFPDEVTEALERCVRLGKTTGWQQSVRDWVTGPDGLHLAAQAEVASRQAASDIARSVPASEPETAPEAIPQASTQTRSAPRPGARPEARSEPALKLAASKSRSMTAADLVPHVAAMLDAYGSVSQAQVKRDLHVSTDKARDALRLARKDRLSVAR